MDFYGKDGNFMRILRDELKQVDLFQNTGDSNKDNKANKALFEQLLRLNAVLVNYYQRELRDIEKRSGAENGSNSKSVKENLEPENEEIKGLLMYMARAKRLLRESKLGANPFKDMDVEVPLGERLDSSNSERFMKMEEIGLKIMSGAAFVLVAGGLGERLSYNGIKVALPVECTTDKCFLQYYVECILSYQDYACRSSGNASLLIPLAIMTSDDTHEETKRLLDENSNFGMLEGQIMLMKQAKVPAIIDDESHFAYKVIKSDDGVEKKEIITKPHGHGDVHFLLHSTGILKQWKEEGRQWVCFFQDTNPLVFSSFPAALGVSVQNDFIMNSIAIPRRPGEQIGAICKLIDENSSLTINVEYNQLDALLKDADGKGDVAGENGFSDFPGNINATIYNLSKYYEILQKSGGLVPEFVNPKYKDEKLRTEFKKPTRLETMMQDFPKLAQNDLKLSKRIGFTEMERWVSFSPVKNNIHDAALKLKKTGFGESAADSESALYSRNRNFLAITGCKVKTDDLDCLYFAGLPFLSGARIVLSPSFACTLSQCKSKFITPDKVIISSRSTLILEGDIEIHSLNLDGALHVRAVHGTKIIIKKLKIVNEGSTLQSIDVEDTKIDQKYRIRGYKIIDKEIVFIDAKHGNQPIVIDRD